MKNVLGIVLIILGFLELILLNISSTFDKILYSGKNHFCGFMDAFGLWPFFVLALLLVILGILLILFHKK